MMRVLLLAAAAMATYEECHLYRSAVIARERAPALAARLFDTSTAAGVPNECFWRVVEYVWRLAAALG